MSVSVIRTVADHTQIPAAAQDYVLATLGMAQLPPRPPRAGPPPPANRVVKAALDIPGKVKHRVMAAVVALEAARYVESCDPPPLCTRLLLRAQEGNAEAVEAWNYLQSIQRH